MHSFLYFMRDGYPHISTLFYTCNMQKSENKAIFLRIFGETAKNEGIFSRQQNATEVCMASRPANTPARLAAWTASQNYVLLFSQPCRQYSHTKHSGVSRQAHFRRQPETIFRQPSSFLQSNLNLQPANTIPSGSSGQYSPAANLSISVLTTFHQPVYNNSRQVKPAGCQYTPPLHFSFSFFPLFFLFFFSYFSGIILNTGSSSTGSSRL